MSLVPTWVRMKNSKWYRDPVIYDKFELASWYICFDDKDPAEIVIQKPDKQLTKKERKLAIENLLKNIGIDARIISHNVSGSRFFPPKWNVMAPAITAFIEIKSQIDSNNYQIDSEEIKNTIPQGEGVYYQFE